MSDNGLFAGALGEGSYPMCFRAPQRLQQVLLLTIRRGWLALALGFGLLLAGCGQVTHAGSTSLTATQSAIQSPSAGNGATANGCPSKQLPADGGIFRPDVTITSSQDLGATQSFALTQGQRLEIHLDPTTQWNLTTTDPAHVLDSMTPAGWYDASLNACVWRFTAVGAGTDHLAFRGPVLCPPNIRCTAVLEQVAFDVTVR